MKRFFGVFALLLIETPLFCAADDLIDAESIVSQLLAQPGVSYKSMMKAPDPNNHLCGKAAFVPPSMQSSFRNLYAEESPSADLDVMFDFGKASLLPEGRKQLDELAKALKTTELMRKKFTIAGHTDSQGSEDFNDKLSCARALSAREYLIKSHGVAAERLIPLGFGMQRPKNSVDLLAPENRRVEVRFIPNQAN